MNEEKITNIEEKKTTTISEERRKELKAYKHQWYLDNKDRIAAARQKYRDEHKEERKEYDKRRAIEKKDELKAQRKKYYERTKEERREKSKQEQRSPAGYDTYFPKLEKYYESDQLRRDPDNLELLQVRCHNQNCQEWFNPTVGQVRHRYYAIVGWNQDRTHGECHLYCSDECKRTCPTFNKKEWAEGTRPNYNREVQPELRAMVLARDNYTCQREGCNKSLKDYPDLVLHCHHKFPLNEDPVCSADIDNCITLCEECHKWVHQNVPGCKTSDLKCTK